MIKSSIHIPIIKIYVNYSMSSIEPIGLLQLEVLDIYNICITNQNFNNYKFSDIFKEILKIEIPTVFLLNALNYLNNEKILINKNKDLSSQALKNFKIDKNQLQLILKNKGLYSKPQKKNISLYYHPFSRKFIQNTNEFNDTFDVFDGDNFKNTHIANNKISDNIKQLKTEETSFNRSEVKITIEDSRKREIVYINENIEYDFTSKEKYNFDIKFTDRYKFLDNYKNEFIKKLINEDKLLLDLEGVIIENHLIEDIDNIKKNLKGTEVKINNNIQVLNDIEEINRVTNKSITDIVNSSFKNIKDGRLFHIDKIELEKLENFINQNELIRKEIIRHLIELNIHRFVKRLIAINSIIDENIRKIINETIFEIYINKQNYTKNKLESLFEDWEFHPSDSDKVNTKSIQEQLLLQMDKSKTLLPQEIQKINNRYFVLDTNVFLTQDICILERGNIILSIAVIEELDDVKKNQPDTRKKISAIQKYLNSNKDIKYEDAKDAIKLLPEEFRKNKQDNRILALCFKDKENRILVTNDQNLQIKAKASNIKSMNSEIYLKGDN